MPFLPSSKKDQASQVVPGVKRLSRECKATVKIGAFSRGGKTRGEYNASDHDFGGTEQDIPCGILDEDTAQLHVPCGSSAKTSDFLVATLTAWWQGLTVQEQHSIERVQLKMANGPESSGVRTQFLHRLVHLVATLGKPIPLLYYPPYHSKDNPIERCGGILELPWNGTQLRDAETMLEWAKRMTWKGLKPVVELSRKVYAKGVTLSKTAMQAVEARLERNPLLPKWDILIHPARAT
jgi:Rhodopirellula transposase DDE domain